LKDIRVDEENLTVEIDEAVLIEDLVMILEADLVEIEILES
jgi:hypothetical protein